MKATTYQTIDGATFIATDAADLMRQLRQDSWNPENSDEAYRIATAKACKMQTGKFHRDDSPEALVQDMIASGLVIPQPQN